MKMKYIMLFVFFSLSACSDNSEKVLHGYVEAEPIYIAANAGGHLKQLLVQRGGEAKAGQLLFTLDSELEHAQITEAKARVAQAAASAKQAKVEFERQQKLWQQRLIAENTVDQARAQHIAMQADMEASQSQTVQRHWQLDQRSLKAPIAAHIEQTFYREGEWIPAGAPVIELLDAKAIKIRFYVPEPELNNYSPGTKIKILCDNCKPNSATVTYQASEAEFTPPVIYSRENRAKLVYLVEAKPASPAQLRPGQPVDIIK